MSGLKYCELSLEFFCVDLPPLFLKVLKGHISRDLKDPIGVHFGSNLYDSEK